MTYDANGNILTLKRYGLEETEQQTFEIDDLTYIYDGNQLKNVTDATNYSEGFDDGNKHTQTGQNDYEYDAYGNMIKDRNKGITQITYNHLNLPKEIKFANNDKIEYIYTATGEKLRKKVTEGGQTQTIEYLEGFQYVEGELSFFPTAEGYVKVTLSRDNDLVFTYVYNYTDHLGNIRLRYTRNPVFPSGVRILEEDHYYPFGLKHKGYNNEHNIIVPPHTPIPINPTVIIPITPDLVEEYKYKYNGKEFQDELSLNWYDYGARNYDPALGRWMNMDPLAEIFYGVSPFIYVLNNPINLIDPTGMAPEGCGFGCKIRKSFNKLFFKKSEILPDGRVNRSRATGWEKRKSRIANKKTKPSSGRGELQIISPVRTVKTSLEVNFYMVDPISISKHKTYSGINSSDLISIDGIVKDIISGPNDITFDFASTLGRINTAEGTQTLISEIYPLNEALRENLKNIAKALINNPNATVRFQYTDTSGLSISEARKVEEIYGLNFLQITNYLIRQGVKNPNKRVLKSLGENRRVILNMK